MEPTACLLLRLFEKHHALQLPFSPSSLLQLFWNIREFGAKKYFTYHQTANTISYLVL